MDKWQGEFGARYISSQTGWNPLQIEEEALLRWTEYYATALNHPVAQPCPDLEYSAAGAIDHQRIPLDAPSLDEVLAAINKLKQRTLARLR